MKGRALATARVVLIGLGAAGCARPRDPPTLATLVAGQGTVERGRGGSYAPAAVGTPLRAGDALRTSSGSSARLAFAGGRVVRLGEQSLVRVVTAAAGPEPAVAVEFGQAFSEGEPPFLLATTRGMIALEPRTQLKVRASTKSTRFEVMEGRASMLDVANAAPLVAGEGIEIGSGGSEITRFRSEAPAPPSGGR